MKTNISEILGFFTYKRIIVIGCPGSGKSTFSKTLSKIIGVPVVHLDKLYWLPNWISVEREEFDRLLDIELGKEAWIMDGNFQRTMDKRILVSKLIIFLDLPSEVCLNSYLKRVETKAVKGFITEGCVESIDEEFMTYIRDYNQNQRENNYKRILDSGKDYIVFTSREEINSFLVELEEANLEYRRK